MGTNNEQMPDGLLIPKGATVLPHHGVWPDIASSVMIAPGARIVGEVSIGSESSIWYNVVIRGDVNFVSIGDQTNIQDGSILHVTKDTHPLIIGNRVTAGHAVRLHGCTVEDETLIGIGAVVLDGAVVEHHSMVAAGAVVAPGFVVPSGKLVAGVPARVLRDLRDSEVENFGRSADRYVRHAAESRTDLASL